MPIAYGAWNAWRVYRAGGTEAESLIIGGVSGLYMSVLFTAGGLSLFFTIAAFGLLMLEGSVAWFAFFTLWTVPCVGAFWWAFVSLRQHQRVVKAIVNGTQSPNVAVWGPTERRGS